MTSILRLTLPLLFLVSAASAQQHDGAFFASVGAGLAAHDNGAFSRRLQSYTPSAGDGGELIYRTEEFSSAGTTLNGSLGIMVAGGYLFGVAAERVGYPTVYSITAPGNPRDEYGLSAAGGGLDVGYAFVNDGPTLVYPFVHGGYYSYTLDYTNNQALPIPFFEGQPVPSGTTATYSGAGARWALGVGMVHFLGGGSGGVAVAARLTWGMMLSRAEWLEPDGSTVKNGGLTPGYNGVVLSLSIGGGTSW